jgi:hypothetical protein
MNQLELIGESIWNTYRSMGSIIAEASVHHWKDKAGSRRSLRINPRKGPEKSWTTEVEKKGWGPGGSTAILTRKHRSRQGSKLKKGKQPAGASSHEWAKPTDKPDHIVYQQKNRGETGTVQTRDPKTKEIKTTEHFPVPATNPAAKGGVVTTPPPKRLTLTRQENPQLKTLLQNEPIRTNRGVCLEYL